MRWTVSGTGAVLSCVQFEGGDVKLNDPDVVIGRPLRARAAEKGAKGSKHLGAILADTDAARLRARRPKMLKRIIVLSAFVVPALSLGCKTAEDRGQEAAEVQRVATEKIQQAEEKAREEIQKAKTQAEQKIASIQADFDKLRENYRHEVTGKLVGVDESIAKYGAKSRNDSPNAKKVSEPRFAEMQAKRSQFQKSFDSLRDASASTWDASRAAVELEWTALDKFINQRV
jgi:pyruvate/2-oxoglutarate dehydrogenase complex dihydrolipoamide acyltransferase (E2) component